MWFPIPLFWWVFLFLSNNWSVKYLWTFWWRYGSIAMFLQHYQLTSVGMKQQCCRPTENKHSTTRTIADFHWCLCYTKPKFLRKILTGAMNFTWKRSKTGGLLSCKIRIVCIWEISLVDRLVQSEVNFPAVERVTCRPASLIWLCRSSFLALTSVSVLLLVATDCCGQSTCPQFWLFGCSRSQLQVKTHQCEFCTVALVCIKTAFPR